MLSLLGAKGQHFRVRVDNSNEKSQQSIEPIHKDEILIPDIVLDDQEHDISKLMKPIFDIIWNIGGWRASLNFDDNGNWTGN